MKKLTITIAAFLVAFTLFAEAPSTYYNAAEGKTNNVLRLALQGIIDNHSVMNYDNLEDYYPSIDATADNTVWDMYSTCTFAFADANCEQHNVCDCWNKEHSVPKSWFGESLPMKSDLFHVYPTDSRVNNFRSNYAYGETSSTSYVASDSHSLGRLGSSNFSGYSGTVYEPDDEFKGDLARTYFYMATRYADKCSSWTGGMFGSNYNGLTTYGRNLLLKWHREDPVSVKETLRNDGVYVFQHNRNPFIDNPELVEYIWGTQTSEAWYKESTPIEYAAFQQLVLAPNPTKDVVVIKSESGEELAYSIMNLAGQTLQTGLTFSGNAIALDGFTSGVYMIQIKANGKSQVLKLLIN